MAQTITILPEKITSTDANNFVITIDDSNIDWLDADPIVLIDIVSGVWKFGVGQTAANSSATYSVGEKVDLRLRKEDGKRTQLQLNAQAENANEEFKMSAL